MTPPGRGRSTKEIDVSKRTPGKSAGAGCTACGRSKSAEPERFRIRRRRGRDALYHLCRPCEAQKRHEGNVRRIASASECSVIGCDRPVWARDWCPAHYSRWRAKGDVGTAERRRRGDGTDSCSYPGCRRPHLARGLCGGHYQQQAEGRQLAPLRSSRDQRARDEAGRKQCRRCLTWLGVVDFYRNARSSDGLSGTCRRCQRDKQLERDFGITLAEYEAALAAQDGGCATCGMTEAGNGRMLAVDHDHTCCPSKKTCGECIRGLLCSECNLQLGRVADDIDRLEALIGYLRASKARQGRG
ncbi:endonuclease domain-containing protein [Streptomyces sp. NBC_00140]|uniref:endonuclease domain-containing protein n=1 Tax=Streptomyces sp. NBC_00140 TaxID=2975664 RepID=UPI00338E19EC